MTVRDEAVDLYREIAGVLRRLGMTDHAERLEAIAEEIQWETSKEV